MENRGNMKHQREKAEKNDYTYGGSEFCQEVFFFSTFFAKSGFEFMTDFGPIEKNSTGRD